MPFGVDTTKVAKGCVMVMVTKSRATIDTFDIAIASILREEWPATAMRVETQTEFNAL